MSLLHPEDGDNVTMEQIQKRSKWENDDYVCHGIILNGISGSLFDIYQNVESGKELWDRLNIWLRMHQDDDIAWWVDSGVTIHVCKDRCWFKTYESLNDGSILYLRNESTALMHGRGCVDLRFCGKLEGGKGKGLFGPNGGRGRKVEVGFDNFRGGGEEVGNYGGNGGGGSSIFERGEGSLAICSMDSTDGLGGEGLVVVGEECLDGWVRAGGGEVKGGGVDFEVTKSLLGEIPEENTRESGGEEFRVDGGAV
ncbi:hypothetical protein Tco_1556220 [Tanacetum coccineum]